MRPAPLRTTGPLKLPARAYNGVIGHSVVAGVMHVMGPLINIFRTGLDNLCPFAVFFEVGDAVWNQHSHYLIGRNPVRLVTDQQVHEIVNVRQAVCCMLLH